MKRRMSFSFCLFALSCGLALPAGAQSMLNINYPLGVSLRPNCGMAFSMGGTGAAVASEHHLMLSNPANLGTIDKTVFTSLLNAAFLNIHDGSDVANFLSIIPHQVGFGFSLGPAGTIAFSLDSRTDASVKYRALYAGSALGAAVSPVNEIELAFSSNGGITAWQAGWGYSILSRVYVGIAYERAYLSFDASRIQTTRGLSGTVRSIDSASVAWRGNGLRMGIMAPFKSLTIGLAGEYFISSEATYSSAIYWGQDNSAVSNHKEGTATLQLPPSFCVGLSYQPRTDLLLALDASAVFWDYYSFGDILPEARAGATLGFGIGGQYIPAPNLLAPRYWETIRYRAGIRYQELPAPGNREFAVSLGAGLPLRANGLFDIVAEYGWRNDERYQSYGEEFVHFAVGVNAGRKWTKSAQGSY